MPTAYQPESGVAPSWPLKGAIPSLVLYAKILYARAQGEARVDGNLSGNPADACLFLFIHNIKDLAIINIETYLKLHNAGVEIG
jgi:hypothetical protein